MSGSRTGALKTEGVFVLGSRIGSLSVLYSGDRHEAALSPRVKDFLRD